MTGAQPNAILLPSYLVGPSTYWKVEIEISVVMAFKCSVELYVTGAQLNAISLPSILVGPST